MYNFKSPQFGRCMVEAKTSGKNGFGLPKHFVFTSLDHNFAGTYIVWYRDKEDCRNLGSNQKRNVDLLRVAIGQFCEARDIQGTEGVKLDFDFPVFKSDIANRHGRVISETSALPRRIRPSNPAGAMSLQ